MLQSFKSAIIAMTVLAVAVGAGLYTYQNYLRKVRLAIICDDDTTWAALDAAAQKTPYALHRFERSSLAQIDLSGYQAAFLWAMGLNLSEEQIRTLEKARQAGTKIVVPQSTNQVSASQANVPKEQEKAILDYLRHGGEENMVALLHYVARELAGRDVEVPPLIETPEEGFFYRDGQLFATLQEFEDHVAQHGPKLAAKAPRVALVGPFLRPKQRFGREHLDYLIKGFEGRQVRVYPMFGTDCAKNFLKLVRPDLVVVFPHGRLSRNNEMSELLATVNVPCLSALSLVESVDKWQQDERGLSGGFLSQSISMPELDGAIEPRVILSREQNERGLRVPTIIPDRIERFLDRAANWLKLRYKPNSQKRIVIVYYKAPGLGALAASGLEVCPSLLNVLRRLEKEGYDLGGKLPETPEALFALIQQKGKTLGQWAIGSFGKFLAEAEPELVPAASYAKWFRGALSEKRQKDVLDLWGPIPGKRMVAQKDEQPVLVISRIRLGNVVIMPQPTVGGEGDDEIKSIHGTDKAPPHFYLGAYLWARHGFQADALVHFGTHGSLEFTYGKSAALSRDCWPDILIGDLPHIYPYIINNIGEALVARRRSCAVIVSHLTPPFTESGLYGELGGLHDKIHDFEAVEDPRLKREIGEAIRKLVEKLDLAKDIGLSKEELSSRTLTELELTKLHDYMHLLQEQSITDGLHVIGRDFTNDQVHNTVTQMLDDQAYEAMLAVTNIQGPEEKARRKEYGRALVDGVLGGQFTPEKFFSKEELAKLRAASSEAGPSGKRPRKGSGGHPGSGQPMGKGGGKPSVKSDQFKGHPADQKQENKSVTKRPLAGQAKENSPVRKGLTGGGHRTDLVKFWQDFLVGQKKLVGDPQQKLAFLGAMEDIKRYADALRRSPEIELEAIVKALAGGYILPSAGGDPLFNPESVPTGRNLYSLSAEVTPTEEAWRVGQQLVDEILARQRAQTGRYPRRVAFSFWGSEFLRTKGTSIAQVLYLMGVRPVRNSRGAVYDVEVIPSSELGRPRIDVLVQTSGQFRDAGASRITLMDRAVRLVSELEDEPFPNYVREGSIDAEKQLKGRGYAPKDAREFATARIFGSANNQSYGTGIMSMVEKGDTWQTEQELADRYVHNMGGVYRDGNTWGTFKEGVFEAQMTGTEVVIHSRSSNTWGPLSLDHVYEFMGGISLSIRVKTGTDPTGYFSDQRARGRGKAVTAAAAIRAEARTTLWNPKFIRGMQREGPSAAATLTETVRNIYGWNVMQPAIIDKELWDETYQVFINDKHQLDMRQYFEKKNPYALQDLTAVMLETARKGYWKPSSEVLHKLATVHAELVAKYGAACSYETCGNRALQEFLQGQLNAPGAEILPNVTAAYKANLASALTSSRPLPQVQGIQLDEKTERIEKEPRQPQPEQTAALAGCIVLFTLGLMTVGSRRSRNRPRKSHLVSVGGNARP